MRRLLLTAIAATLFAGCSCSTPPKSAEPRVELLSPTEGQSLSSRDDEDATAPGLQITVKAQASGFGAAPTATLSLDGAAVTSLDGLADDGTASFPGITLSAGSHVVSVAVKSGDVSASASVQVRVEDTPSNLSVDIVTPLDGPLNGTTDGDPTQPGMQVPVKLRIGGVLGGTVHLCSGAAPSGNAPCLRAVGRVVVEKKIGREPEMDFLASLPEGKADLTAEVKDDFSGAVAISPTVNVTVDSVEPTIAFIAPAPGATLTANPFPVQLKTDAEPGQTVTITGGASPVTAKVTGTGDVKATVTGKDGINKLTAEVSDLAGNPAKPAEVTVSIDTSACALSIKTPAGGSVKFNAGDDKDADPSNGLQTDVVANTADCKGRRADLYVNNVKVVSANADLTSGDISFAGITLADGSKDVPVEVRMTDGAGNTAKAGFLATVILKSADLVITTDSTTRNLLNDRDYATAGIQIQALVNATAVNGGNLYLCSTVANATGATPCKKGGFLLTMLVPHTQLATTFQSVTLADGQQTLTAELVDGAGNISVSKGTPILVDSVPPQVTSFTIREDANGDGELSDAELPATASANLDIAVTGAEGQTVTVYAKDGAGSALGTGKVTGGKATVALTLADGSDTLLAKVSSTSGNPNVSTTPSIVNAPAHLKYTVDRTAPVVQLLAPSKALLNKADDTIDPATPDLEFALDASTDAPNGTVAQITVDSGTAQTAMVSSGHVKQQLTFTQGAHTVVVTLTDAAGNSTSAQTTFTVDTVPPTLTVTSPKANDTFTGYSIPVTAASTGAEAGQLVTVTTSAGMTEVGSGAVDASGNASFTLTVPNGAQTLTFTLSDKAGNTATPVTVAITVASTGCQITLTSPAKLPARYGAADDKDKNSSNGLQTDIAATTDCKGRSADLFVNGAKVTTVTSDGISGAVLFPSVTFADGATNVPVSIRMVDATNQPSQLDFTVAGVRLTGPSFVTLLPAKPAAGALTYVAQNNPRVDGTTVIADLVDGGDADAEFTVKVAGAAGGTFDLSLNGKSVVSKPVANDPEDFGKIPVILTQDSTGTLTATVTDAFGNATTVSYSVTVDVMPPDAPAIASTNVTDARSASVRLGWLATGDDGTKGSNAGYDIRYITSTTAATGFGCPTMDAAAYATAAKLTGPAAGAAGQPVNWDATKLPPLNCYTIAVRAVDDVGNLSPLTNAVQVKNYWKETALNGGAAGSTFGILVATGDFDGNGVADLAVSARSEAPSGAVYIYYGTKGAPGATTQVLNNASVQFPGGSRSGLVTNELFGGSLAAGDVDGDGVDDLVIGASSYASNLGRAFIFFGRKGAQVDPTAYVELRGRTAAARFGYAVRVLGDVDGDGKRDVLIGARYDGTCTSTFACQGRAYLYLGRSQAAWTSARSATDTATTPATPYIPATGADLIFVGAASDTLGAREGGSTLGDLDGDKKEEFILPASLDSVNKMYAFNAATVLALPKGVDIDPSKGSTFAPVGGPFTTSGTYEGFGAQSIGGKDFDGDGFPDLLIAHPIMHTVHFFRGDKTGRTIGGEVPASNIDRGVVGGVFFGQSISAADLNGDGALDVVAGNAATSQSFTEAGSFWVYLNSGTTTPFGAANAMLKPATSSYNEVITGDFDGDGKPDIAVTHQVTSSASDQGKVFFYAP